MPIIRSSTTAIPASGFTLRERRSALMACRIALCVILPTREDSEPCDPFHSIQITYAQYQYVSFCDSGDIMYWYGNRIKVNFPPCTIEKHREYWRYMFTHS
jgi:hypothetical protein